MFPIGFMKLFIFGGEGHGKETRKYEDWIWVEDQSLGNGVMGGQENH